MFGEVSPGYRGSPEQRAADGSLPSAGQLHSCPAAQPQPQNEPGGMFDTHLHSITINYHSVIQCVIFIVYLLDVYLWYSESTVIMNCYQFRHIFKYENSVTVKRRYLNSIRCITTFSCFFVPRMSGTQSLKNGPTTGT